MFQFKFWFFNVFDFVQITSEEGRLSEAEDNRFEQLSQEACEWTLLIDKLDDVAVLCAILSISQNDDNVTMPILKYDKPKISLKSILNGGKGIVSELVAKWLTASGICPEKLLEPVIVEKDIEKTESNIHNMYKKYPLNPNELLNNDNKNLSDTHKKETDCNELMETEDFDSILNKLNILRKHFPFSLQSGVLLSHMTWEFMCHWSKNLSNLAYLDAGLKCLDTIRESNYALKHGLCCMIWNAQLKIPLEATKKLINKAGRLPKEKFCLQDIGLSDSLVILKIS